MLRVFMAAELIIFVVGERIDAEGRETLKLFRSIGVTSFVTAIQHSPPTSLKSAAALKKAISNELATQVTPLIERKQGDIDGDWVEGVLSQFRR